MKYNLSYLEPEARSQMSIWTGRNYFRDKQVKVHVFNNAVFLPGRDGKGGLVVDDNYIPDSFIRAGRWSDRSYQINEEELIHYENDVVYLGLVHEIWGHCITDNLKHLWCLLDSEWREKHKDVKYVYSILYGKKLPENFLWIIEKLGVPRENLLEIRYPTIFKTLYFPDASFSYENGFFTFTNHYRQLIEKISSGIAPANIQKVYFSRTKIKGSLFSFKKDYGEKSIEELFKKQGYTIIYPEKLSVENCISIIKGARVLAATEGSVSHNSVFLQTGASLILLRKADIINWYQLALNEVNNLDVTMIDVGKSNVFFDDDCKAMGPFFIYMSRNLLSFFNNSEKYHFPIWSYFRYAIWSRTSKVLRYVKLFIIEQYLRFRKLFHV